MQPGRYDCARVCFIVNLIYEPEVAKPSDAGVWERDSFPGVALGLACRVTPTLALGVGAEYDRAYDGLAFQTLTGGGTITIRIRALEPGRYRFFDDLNPAAQGYPVVQ